MLLLLKRNILLYLRDRVGLFFSMLSPLIVLLLYALFLSRSLVDSLPPLPGAKALMDVWMIAGLLSVTSVTSTFGALSQLVDDRKRRILSDFAASPLTRLRLAAGYAGGAFGAGLLMTALCAVFGAVYLYAADGLLLSPSTWLAALPAAAASVLCSAAAALCFALFLRTTSSYGALQTLLGTLIGFLMGMYVPIGVLPSGVQAFIRFFPLSHGAVLLRKLLLTPQLDGWPQAAKDLFNLELGCAYRYGDFVMPAAGHALVLTGCGAGLLAVCALLLRRRNAGL